MAKPKVTLDEVSQTIDLKAALGVDLSERPDLKQAIGQEIIDIIIDRTESGDGVVFDTKDGKKIRLEGPYSESYAQSLDFKAFGKRKNKVNMTLTGDMINSMNVEESGGSKIKIYVDDSQVPKAYNHITGDTVPRRPWFGITQDELNQIKREFESDLEDAAEEMDASQSGTLTLLDDLAKDGKKGKVTLSNLLEFLGDED